MRLRFALGVVVAALLLASNVQAAETGSVSGIIRDASGNPMPGVTVTISGTYLPAGRSVVTDPAGRFDMQRVAPGQYRLLAELEGLGSVQRSLVIAVDRNTQSDLTLTASLSETITVTAATPVIDAKSTEVSSNFTNEFMEDLPITRSYKGLFQLAPGVSENNRLTPNAGGARMDNTFLVDGINVTNPQYGDIVPNITEIDIEEANIKRAAITAEFGRTGGMVVNAVTKSGSNEIGGEARYEYAPDSLVSDPKGFTGSRSQTDRATPAFAVGGPLLRDYAWYYGSASFPDATTTNRSNNLYPGGGLPDSDVSTDEYFLKITANASQSHLFSGSLRSRETTTTNAGIGSNTHPSVASDDSTDYLLGTLGWTWNVSPRTFVELKLNHNREDNSTAPVTGLGYRPAFDPAHPERMGAFSTTADRIVGGATAAGQTVGGASLAVNNQDFYRDEVRATFRTLRPFFGSDHDIRVGFTYDDSGEDLERRANGWGTVTWSASSQRFTANYVSDQPPHKGRGKAMGVFLQDQLSIGTRTNLTVGVLFNRDEYFGEGLGETPGTKREVKILTFDWDQQVQPRLGITFVPMETLGDKLYFNYGRYYNTENKSLVRAASPTRIFTTRATFDASGTMISEVPAANTQSKTIDPGLDPQYTDEFVLGYARPIGRVWSAELWGMYRDMKDFMEDVSADGLGNGPFRIAQLADAYRRYEAVTLEVGRAVDPALMSLQMNASYTWSRLKGNWDIDYSDSLFYNSSILEDGPGVLITDNRDGLLRGDRTHVVKLFASVKPLERATVGSYVRYQSGGAWEARGLPDPKVSSSGYYRYLESAGSRRMEDWLNVDMLFSYEIPVRAMGVELEARVVNVFDEQVEMTVDDRLIIGRDSTVPNNPNFGKATSYSSPRTIVLSAIFNF